MRDRICIAVSMALVLAVAVGVYSHIGTTRYFNLDEFTVMREGITVAEGKPLYENGGRHFPLVPIVMAGVYKLTGRSLDYLIAARALVVLALGVTLLITFQIGLEVSGLAAGILAASALGANLVFITKGLEVRHDVLAMAFVAAGCLWAIRRRTIFAGLCLGLALACTQKAAVWIAGVVIGAMLDAGSVRGALRLAVSYAGHILFPLAVVVALLVVLNGESVAAFWSVGVLNALGLTTAAANLDYPFLYPRGQLLSILWAQGAAFYLLGLACPAWMAISGRGRPAAVWALAGSVFWLSCPRPFYQTLLPVVPAMAVCVSVVVVAAVGRASRIAGEVGSAAAAVAFVFLVFMPMLLVPGAVREWKAMDGQLETVAYCLDRLEPGDKVLSFGNETVFFESVHPFESQECGRSLRTLDARCIETLADGVGVAIDGTRTRSTSPAVQAWIDSAFKPTWIHNVMMRRG